MIKMAENKTVEQRVDTIETKFEMYMKSQDERFNTFMQELQQQREDIRRAQDRQDAAQAKHDADMKELNARIDSKFDSLMNQIQNMAIAAVVGFGAIAVAVGGIVFAALK